MSETPTFVNRPAKADYQIEDTIEVGIVLNGNEVKSVRNGKIDLKGGYAKIKDGELFLYNIHIPPYQDEELDPYRTRKLLAQKHELKRLKKKTEEKGYTLVPVKAYFKRGKLKIQLGIAKGKQKKDKREQIKEREQKRKIRRQSDI